jgi:RNA polymerase sigma-70 factor (ECF subfamily)
MELSLSEPVELETEHPQSDVWAQSECGRLYNEHSQAIYYLALRLLGNPTQAEDATHDIFLKAFGALSSFRGESQARTWLYRIAINHCRNLAQTWHQRHVFATDDQVALDVGLSADTPLRVLEIKELGERIQNTLDSLPEEYRLLLLLIADKEMSYEEIASLTDQSPDAIRGKLHRARKAFLERFKNAKD